MDRPAMGMSHGAAGSMPPDLNDISFDAYLANDRTLDDPGIVRVDRGGRVRLRIINAASATNFFVDLGGLEATLIAVDGLNVIPLTGSRFELAVAQRIDLRLSLPLESGVYPVLARREGDVARTGILLATKDAPVRKIAGEAETPVGAVGLALERRLSAAMPLPGRPADRVLSVDLTGMMMGYAWGLNGGALDHQRHLAIRHGERVHLVLRNRTDMSHPIHLHGHHFQVVAIDDVPIAGAVRDTVLVPIAGSVTIAFDADNPGLWALHCHNLYHMVAGMMTGIAYAG
jgi:FtsP/CotA-like multicopper oxidase with cupredoxin domain